ANLTGGNVAYLSTGTANNFVMCVDRDGQAPSARFDSATSSLTVDQSSPCVTGPVAPPGWTAGTSAVECPKVESVVMRRAAWANPTPLYEFVATTQALPSGQTFTAMFGEGSPILGALMATQP